MDSPLPDSSALEAGILEDERPSRLSRVQDNVRHLLRTSVFGSVKSSPTTPAHPPPQSSAPMQQAGGPFTPVEGSTRHAPRQPEVLPSPASESSAATHLSGRIAAFPQPPQRSQTLAHQSAVFNTRAVAALNHPDLSDPSMEQLVQQKAERRQRKAWRKKPRRSKKTAQRFAGSRGLLCVLSSLLLAALVATYASIATTVPNLTTTFHVLFVLGICLATIVFAHSVIRLFVIGRRFRDRPVFVAVSRHSHSREHRHHHARRPPHLRHMPTLSTDPAAFVPPTPIPVQVSVDDVRLDPDVAQASAALPTSTESWDKEVHSVANPPPAYGRWRGSVRADPELLHWQAIPSPVSPDTPVLPSPTYQEAMATDQNESPPSYMTRESPARQRELREARAGIAHSQVVEPEMVEVRGIGVGLAA